ncbi:hypothetical protein PC116_g2216 [Phytophthora cactorum]|uniref:Uncharacterized protein n=1 Tax=Phytophthora cactorum TaxID=29920 RepID=A0A8T1LMJ9_9STRA|nr:hypothetical protein PC113_g22915 [Phytophthora cactorum]KAG3137314.1 hypothetical protein PC128_g25764 [Phytophthora cactorum]KAG4250040.1 hypothetical protein PC116_g2216 [Phytophthora cactorum]
MGRELVQVAEQRVEETAMDEATRDVDMESMANSSYVGSSPPSQTPPIGATPGSDVPFSLASISSDLLSYKLAQRSQDDSNGDSLAGSSPTEQDQGFSYEMTEMIQLMHEEDRLIYGTVGLDAYPTGDSPAAGFGSLDLPTRHMPPAISQRRAEPYHVILHCTDPAELAPAHVIKLQTAIAANHAAYACWYNREERMAIRR